MTVFGYFFIPSQKKSFLVRFPIVLSDFCGKII